MKRTFFLLTLVFATAAFTGCGSNDDNNNNNERMNDGTGPSTDDNIHPDNNTGTDNTNGDRNNENADTSGGGMNR